MECFRPNLFNMERMARRNLSVLYCSQVVRYWSEVDACFRQLYSEMCETMSMFPSMYFNNIFFLSIHEMKCGQWHTMQGKTLAESM